METEVDLGIGEEARPCSEMESAKQHDDSGEKTLKDDVAATAAQENGVRVSENGVVGTSRVVDNDSGVIEDCVMNGVSSLLKLKQDSSDKASKEEDEIDEVDEDDDAEDEEEDDEEEEHGYHVGDFVWGKIKNHPWWPGQIYDPSDASDLALKMKQKGKLLVAYFGDGTFAWCGPSQLKPFAESFKECSKSSNSRSFLSAVEEAVEEMGRHIERLLICGCGEEKDQFDNPEAKNAGIKEGVLVRDVRREMISSLVVGKPEAILEDVKSFAETVCFSGLLELEILKRKVSAFYRSKRGYGLPEYHEPQSVPGLEDKNNDDDDDDDRLKARHSGVKRLSKEGVKEAEDEAGLDPEEPLQRMVEKCSGFPDHRLHHRRKQKSIAEILQNDSAAKVRLATEPENGNAKSTKKKLKRLGEVELSTVTTTTPRRRRTSEVSTIEDGGHKQVGENSKGQTYPRKRKKKAVDDDDDQNGDREETEKNEISDSEIDIDSTPLASLRKRARVDASSVERTAGNGENTGQTSKRERKKSKYLSPEYLSDFSSKGRKKNKTEPDSSRASTQSQVGEQMTDARDGLVAVAEDKLDKPCEPSLDNGIGHQELSEELSNAIDFLRLGATPMEMRDLIRVAALGTEYPKDSSSRDMVREFMSIYRSFTYNDGANSKFLGSYNSSDKEKEELSEARGPVTKGSKREGKNRKAEHQTEEIEQIGKEENETEKHVMKKKEQKSEKAKSEKQGDEEEKTRKEAGESSKKERKRKKPESKKEGDGEEETGKEASESTKKERKRKKPESKKQGDGEEETGKEVSESTRKERKLKKPESKPQADEEGETLKMLNVSTKKERKAKKPKYEEEGTPNESEKPKEKKKKREEKSKMKEAEEEFSGAELYVTFGPGSSLPKKEELVEIYKKFGPLEEERTSMLDNNLSARVAFLNIADGEKAFESSQEKCPFASASTVKFRLKYPNERVEKKKKAEAEVAETTIGMEYVKKKLDEMRSVVDECEGGMSEEVKVKFADELGNLLKKVKKMEST